MQVLDVCECRVVQMCVSAGVLDVCEVGRCADVCECRGVGVTCKASEV